MIELANTLIKDRWFKVLATGVILLLAYYSFNKDLKIGPVAISNSKTDTLVVKVRDTVKIPLPSDTVRDTVKLSSKAKLVTQTVVQRPTCRLQDVNPDKIVSKCHEIYSGLSKPVETAMVSPPWRDPLPIAVASVMPTRLITQDSTKTKKDSTIQDSLPLLPK